MTLAGDSITVSPGSGATVATHTVASKEHQVVMVADATGHLHGTKAAWIAATGNLANVAAARTTHFEFFNASGSGVVLRVVGLYLLPTLTAVTGIGLTWELIRTSAVGTGGASVTPRPADTASSALPAQVTMSTKPTGGATTNYILDYINSSSEETIAYGSIASAVNHIHVACVQSVVCHEGEGIKVDQTTSSSVGSTNHVVVFTVE